jgi:hypothetical protein
VSLGLLPRGTEETIILAEEVGKLKSAVACALSTWSSAFASCRSPDGPRAKLVRLIFKKREAGTTNGRPNSRCTNGFKALRNH